MRFRTPSGESVEMAASEYDPMTMLNFTVERMTGAEAIALAASLSLALGYGWRVTSDHAASSYGRPVLVDQDGTAYGEQDIIVDPAPGELPPYEPFGAHRGEGGGTK